MSSISTAANASACVGLQRLFWRIHFWAGLVTAPIVLFAAFTGLLCVFTPQIEARLHADVDRVPVRGASQPLDAQWAAVQRAAPGWTPRHIVLGHEPQYRFDKQWRLCVGIDNLNNKKYWAFHPYPQRTFNAELRYDH